MLGACGGGGSTPTPQATGGGTGTGTPPTATPTPTYTAFNDLSGPQEFDTVCAAVGVFTDRQPRVVKLDEGFNFQLEPATNESWTIAGPSPDADFNQVFTRDENTFEEPGIFINYLDLTPTGAGRLPANFSIFTPQWPDDTPEYLRLSTFSPSSRDLDMDIPDYECVFGVPLVLGDTLPSTQQTYTTQFAVSGTYYVFDGPFAATFNLFPSNFNAALDPATGIVDFTLELKGTQVAFLDVLTGFRPAPEPADIRDFGTYTGQATLSDQERAFSGELNKENAINPSTAFSGWLFGPQGAEIGIAAAGSENLVDGANVAFSFTVAAPQVE